MSTHKIKGEDYYQCRDVKAERDKLLEEVAELLDRLEAAEKERDDVAMQLAQSEQGKRKISEECDTLLARIEAMEQQEPVAFALYSGWARKAVYLSEIEACDQRDRRQLTADLGGSLEAYRVAPLCLAPGAKGE